MFCGKCGAENADGAKFCTKCGQPLESAGKDQAAKTPLGSQGTAGGGSNGTAGQASAPNVSQIMEKAKAVPKTTIIGVCAAAAVAAVAFVILVCVMLSAGKTINLNKYLTLEASGYDGYGSAVPSIDWREIEKKYGKKLAFTSAAKREAGAFLSMMTPLELVQQSVSVEFDKSSGLSNGDKVAYTWTVDKELSKYVKCKVKYKDGTYTVSDLAEVGTFDAFAGLDVRFSGTAPDGMAEISYNGGDLDLYSFQCDKTYGLKNGDTVEVKLVNTQMEYYAESYGKIPAATSKTYTVSGLQEYVSAYSDLPDSFLTTVKTETEDTIYSYAAKSYDKTTALNNLEYAGYVLNSLKESGRGGDYNALYIIYKGDVSSTEGKFATSKVYFPVKFYNILKGEGDALTYEKGGSVTGYSNLNGSWYSTNGYVNPLTCYMELVEQYRDVYTAECGDGFEVYSEYEKIEKLDDISEIYKGILGTDAKDKIESYIASTYSAEVTAENLSLAGDYLLLAKAQGNDFAKNNSYIVVYSATVSHSKGNFETTTVYFPVEYDGIVKLPGDEYMVTATIGILGNSNMPNSYYYTKGYCDGTNMYAEIITAMRDKYTYEVSDGLKEFGE